MEKLKFVHWQDKDSWLGFLVEFPDDVMQGETLDDLKENLQEIYKEFNGGKMACIREVGEMDFP